jgi:hypothetical protein
LLLFAVGIVSKHLTISEIGGVVGVHWLPVFDSFNIQGHGAPVKSFEISVAYGSAGFIVICICFGYVK